MTNGNKRKIKTMQLQGNDYAKVAERLKLFREDWPNSKTETDNKKDSEGVMEFKAWLWKDKDQLIDLMKSGVTDIKVLRSSCDSDGNSSGLVKDKKSYEKLQTIAIGRALANLGYLGSGDIASFEEMEEYYTYKDEQKVGAIKEAIAKITSAKTNDQLNEIIKSIGDMLNESEVIQAGKAKREELTKKEKPEVIESVRD